MSRFLPELSTPARQLVSRWMREKMRSSIHVSGVRTELTEILDHAQEQGYSPDGFLSAWSPYALQLTIERQKALNSVLTRLTSKQGRRLLGERTADEVDRSRPAKGLHRVEPKLFASSRVSLNQTMQSLMVEVSGDLLHQLDGIAIVLRRLDSGGVAA